MAAGKAATVLIALCHRGRSGTASGHGSSHSQLRLVKIKALLRKL